MFAGLVLWGRDRHAELIGERKSGVVPAKSDGNPPLETGALTESDPFSSFLGSLSDRFGRRPVLLVSLMGLALDYVIIAVASSLSGDPSVNQTPRRNRRLLLAATAASVAVPIRSFGKSSSGYPSKPIKLVVPIAAGGGTDLSSRMLAGPLGTILGQPINIEYMPGLGTMRGAEAVAKAPADGYTMLMAGPASLVFAPLLHGKTPYDPVRDFAHVALTNRFPMVLLVSPLLSQARSVQELLAQARRARGNLTYASPGNGTPHHLTMELLLQAASVRMTHVPFKGSGQALKEIVDGHVQATFCELPAALALIQSGKARPIGLASKARSPLLPDVATIAEQGLADFEFSGWQGLVMPAGLRPEIIARVADAQKKVMADEQFVQRFSQAGFEPAQNKPDAMAELMRSDLAKWKDIIQKAHIKGD